MKPSTFASPLKELFAHHQFELCDEQCDEEYLSLSFIKLDFRVEVTYDGSDGELYLRLDRPFYGFKESAELNDSFDAMELSAQFITKINSLITEDKNLPVLKKEDCELFLNTGNYDGMSSGVIEYQGSLYCINSITSPYHKDRSAADRTNRVWRHFYVSPLTKEELEKIVMCSLDWMRNINLTPLCKDWKKNYSVDTGDETTKEAHFKGKYRNSVKPEGKPVMKLTLHY